MNWTEILLNIASTAAAITIATIAVLGYISWRKRELWERDKYETAKEVLKYAFRIRDKIKIARSPFIAAGEWADREREEGERENEARILDTHYALVNRFSPILDITAEFETMAVEVEALWDQEYKRPCSALVNHYHKLIRSLNMFTRYSLEVARRGDHLNQLRDIIDREEQVIYSFSNELETDAYESELNEIIALIESRFGDVVREKKKQSFLVRLKLRSVKL